MKALNFGSLNLDYVYQVEHFVQPGETLSAMSQAVNPGGKGLNQSIALAKAGAEVSHAGCLGLGGEVLGELLQKNGVDTGYLHFTDSIQGNAVIQVNAEGQNCILLFGGSNQCVTDTQVTETLAHFAAGDYLVLQNEINDLPLIVDEAYRRGMRIVLNPSPYNEKLRAVDFGKKAARRFSISAAAAEGASATIGIHLDAPGGPLLGTVEIAPTGSADTYRTQTIGLASKLAAGTHDLHFCIERARGDVRLDWWQFAR